MTEVETLRVAPQLGPTNSKAGLLSIDNYDLQGTILPSYSPYPSVGDSDHSRDPFGLNAFLLAPHDQRWEYIRPTPLPNSVLAEEEGPTAPPPRPPRARPVSSGVRGRSPLSSNPPLSADAQASAALDEPTAGPSVCSQEDDEHDEPPVASPSPTRRPISTNAKGLRALIGRKGQATGLDSTASSRSSLSSLASSTVTEDGMLSSRTDSVCSAISAMSSGSSSDSSCDGIQTPREKGQSTDDVSAASARLAATLEEDRKPKATWRGWLGNRRTSFLGLRSEGSSLLDNPQPSELTPEIPDAPVAPVTDGNAPDNEATRSAAQLRRASLVKMAALRMPSPHPLALLLTRHNVNLPDEVAFSIPATKRVYPMSVNVVQKGATELAPSQGGLRLALAVRNVITKIDAGERPTETMQARRTNRQSHHIARPRGASDFITRPPFEERMYVYLPGDQCQHVSMARSGYAIEELDFSKYIVALSETEELPSAQSSQSLSSRGSSLRPSRASASAKGSKAVANRKSVAESVGVNRRSVAITESGAAHRKSVAESSSAPATPKSSLRSRPKPTTWDDSSDDEESENEVAPLKAAVPRPRANRTQSMPSRVRDSKLMDPDTALIAVTQARERRHEFNSGAVDRQVVSEQRRLSMAPQSMAPPPRPQAKHRASSMTLNAQPKVPTRPNASTPTLVDERQSRHVSKRASSATLGANAKSQSRPTASGSRTPPKQQRPPSSLPASPRLKSLPNDRRRVVSQYEPHMPALTHRASMMGINMYGQPVAAVPVVYAPPLVPRASMLFSPMHSPIAMPPQIAYPQQQYHPQFASGIPQMYVQPKMPSTGRRRERPVS